VLSTVKAGLMEAGPVEEFRLQRMGKCAVQPVISALYQRPMSTLPGKDNVDVGIFAAVIVRINSACQRP
jgi:hypothetical protein